MRVDQDDAARGEPTVPLVIRVSGLHQVLHQPQQQARLPAAGLGYRQQMTPQESGGQVHRDGMALVRRTPIRQALPSPRATVAGSGRRRRAVVRSTNGTSSSACSEMPQSGELADVQQARPGSGASTRRSVSSRIE